MAWPDSPPQAQLDVYNAGLSGLTAFVYLRDGITTADEPREYFDTPPPGDYVIKAGWYFSAELAAYLANPAPTPDPAPTAPTGTVAALAVAKFLGQGDDQELVDLAAEHVVVIEQMARAYTRDRGFELGQINDGIKAVITSATARLVANPEQLRYGVGSVQFNSAFQGWSLAELAVLNRYRKRAS